MENPSKRIYEIVDVCLLAGKIMMENGAETYRVEDTMMRIAASFGIHHSHSFVTPTGIIFSIDGSDPTKFIRITERTTDLHKVTKVNSLSRLMSGGELTLSEAYQELKEVEKDKVIHSTFFQIMAAAFVSSCFTIMYQGSWYDFIPAFVAGGIGYSAVIYFHRLVQIKFFAELISSFIIGIISYAFVYFGVGHQLDKIIIGSVMPLVPGVLITNAVRDLMAGHLVSGLSKGAEAFLTSFAIGTGIAVMYATFF